MEQAPHPPINSSPIVAKMLSK